MSSSVSWGGIPSDRVVAIVAQLDTGRVQIGTGYLVTNDTVLTAQHCLDDRQTRRPAVSLHVVRRSDGAQANARLLASVLDIAVLATPANDGWHSATALDKLAFGRVDTTHSGELLDCEALGFPLWQYDPVAEQRSAAELHGTIRTTEGAETGVLILRDPLLRDVSVARADTREEDGGPSPWGGLSGALVFYRGTALGIIIAHYPRQGNSALTVQTIARIADLAAEGDPDAQKIATALGLPAAHDLPVVRQHRPLGLGSTPDPPRFHGVPRTNALFVGRSRELTRLRDRLAQSPHQALVPHAAVGLGGVGKTEIAVEYCHRFRKAYSYVWWVSAASRPILVEQMSSFAPSVGIPASGLSPELLMTYVREWLEGNQDRWLLVMDNADDPAVLHGALPVRGLGHVILTSRFVDWEPLGVDPLPIEPLPVDESAELLVRRSGRAASAEASALGERLGGLPLALYQAGAFIQHSGWSFAQYSASLESRAEALLADNSAYLYRPTGESLTTISVWDRSLEAAAQRAPAAQPIMEVLACYEAEAIPRSLLAAPLIAADDVEIERALSALGQLSLITYANQYISLHRLVQEAVRARTIMLGGTRALGQSLDVASQLLDCTFPQDPDDTYLWHTCAELAGHCSRIADAAIRAQWTGPGLVSVVIRTAQYLNSRGSREEALALLDKAEQVFPSAGTQALRVRLLSNRARVERNLGLLAEAERDARAAMMLSANDCADSRPEALEILGRILLDNGDLSAAKETLWAGLDAARTTLGGTRYEVIALNYIARAHTYSGDLDDARRMLLEALDLDRRLHDQEHADTAWTLDNLGLVELAANDLTSAEVHFRRALDIEAVVHGPEHPRSGWSLRNLAQTLVRKGDVAAAILYYERSLKVIEHATPGNLKEISATVRGLAEAETIRGNKAGADAYMRRLGGLAAS